MNLKNIRFDVHHHILPSFYKDYLNFNGISYAGGKYLPDWTESKMNRLMKYSNTQKAITSISCPGVHLGDSAKAVDMARRLNQYSAEMCSRNYKNIGFFATIPNPDASNSVKQAIYALDVLKADGIVMLANSRGVFLGSNIYQQLMKQLNQRNAVVFVHPNTHETTKQLQLEQPDYIMEFLFDTTRAAFNLIYQGVLHRYPNIKWILAHAGGTLPYFAWRLQAVDLDLQFRMRAPKGVMSYIKQFYYDTALSVSPYALKGLLQLVGPQKILFGSDFPFANELIVAKQIYDLQKLEFLEPYLSKIESENAFNLFNKYKKNEQ